MQPGARNPLHSFVESSWLKGFGMSVRLDIFIFVFIYLFVYFNWNETILITAESVLDYVGGPSAIVMKCLLKREEPSLAVVSR